MKTTRSFALVAALLLPAGSAVAEVATGDAAAVQDVFYLGDEGLVAIRFHLYVGGQPYRTAWAKFLDEMFDRLDADDNRELTGEELKGIPSRSLMEQFGMLSGGSVASQLGTEPDAAPRDGKVTRQELGDYFERVGLPPFRISVDSATNETRILRPGMASPEEAPKALLKHLDTGGDGRISAEEFLAAADSLRKQDLDRDEAISIAELTPTTNMFQAVALSRTTPRTSDARFVAMASSDSPRSNIERLLKQYDGRSGGPADKNGRLSADELGYDTPSFSGLDADGDGQLDFEEIRNLLSHPVPRHEVTVRLGSRKRGQPVFELKNQAAANPENESARLSLGTSQLELSASDSNRTWNVQTTLTEQFKNIDQDGNGYLEEAEMRRFGVQPNRFKMLDPDSDGKVFEKEMLDVVAPLFALDVQRVRIQIVDRGRDLFRILDTSGDGRIGRRELRSAADRMSAWDAGGDGQVEPDEIPQQYRLVVSRSTPTLAGRVSDVSASMADGQVRVRPTNDGPAWFNKMDRNSDGDVSASEFLGPAEVFEEFDADGDGLVDAREAAKL